MNIQNLINMSFEIFRTHRDLIGGQNLAISPFSIISIINILSQNLDESSKKAGKNFFKKHFSSPVLKDQPCEEQSKENIIKCNSESLENVDEKSDSLNSKDENYEMFFSIIENAQERVVEQYTESLSITAIYYNKNRIVNNSTELKIRREKFIKNTLPFNFKFFPLDFKNKSDAVDEILRSLETFSGLTVSDYDLKDKEDKEEKDFDFILLNTPTFCGKWEIPFKQNPNEDDFYGSSDENSKVCMMEAFGEYLTYQDDDFIAVRLKYAASDYSFTILMPKDGKSLEDIKDNFLLNIDYNKWYKNFILESLMINLPAFKILTDICLPDLFNKLELKDIFNDKYLKEMFLGEDNQNVHARQIFSLEVNPIGTNFNEQKEVINHENQDDTNDEKQDDVDDEKQDDVDDENQKVINHENQKVINDENQDDVNHEKQDDKEKPCNVSKRTITFNKPFLFFINGRIETSEGDFEEFPFFMGQCDNLNTSQN